MFKLFTFASDLVKVLLSNNKFLLFFFSLTKLIT